MCGGGNGGWEESWVLNVVKSGPTSLMLLPCVEGPSLGVNTDGVEVVGCLSCGARSSSDSSLGSIVPRATNSSGSIYVFDRDDVVVLEGG